MVRSMAGNEGKIVTCVSIEYNPYTIEFGTVWIIDRFLPNILGGKSRWVPDAWLRPIRDNPGQDETLEWKEVPENEMYEQS